MATKAAERELPKEYPPYGSAQFSASGWQDMSKTVRDVDEEKIRDCKEDIDTLLVFAGLFSAVLTAFLIESYASLQPDNGAEVVFLLRQLVSQNYTLSSGFANSTSPFPSDPSFEAPLWAIRVNELWFASLILSLATASFGMLVKQWLREYLAGEWISPQERLRSRQYRNPSLIGWKVFEIAAILPLLLQLSLGLFFIGLCFFTAAIDARLNRTTLFLVCSWGFFLLMTTLAPLVSPRCPFKVPLLKNAMKSGRLHVTRAVFRALAKIHQKARSLTAKANTTKFTMAPEEDEIIARAEGDADILLSVDAQLSDDGLLGIMWEVLKQPRPDPQVSVSFIVELIKHRVGSTLPTPIPARDIPFIPDLRALSRRSHWAIMTMLADNLSTYATGRLMRSSPNPQWIMDSVILLLSQSAQPLPGHAINQLRTLMSDRECLCYTGNIIGNYLSRIIAHQFTPLSSRLLSITQSDAGKCCITWGLRIYNSIICHLTGFSFHSVLPLVRQHPDLFSNTQLQLVLDDLWQFAFHALRFEYKRIARKASYSHGSTDAFMLLTEITHPMAPRRNLFVQLCAKMGRTYTMRYTYHTYASAVNPRCRARDERTQLFVDAFMQSSTKDRREMLSTTCDVLESFENGNYAKYATQLDIVRVCLLELRIYEAHLAEPLPLESADVDSDGSPIALLTPRDSAWADLWTRLASSVRKYHKNSGWKAYSNFSTPVKMTAADLVEMERELAEECLVLIDACQARLDHDTQEGLKEAAVPDGVTSPPASSPTSMPASAFPDKLIVALGLFIPTDRVEEFPRLEKLRPPDVEVTEPVEEESENAKGKRPVTTKPGEPKKVGKAANDKKTDNKKADEEKVSIAVKKAPIKAADDKKADKEKKVATRTAAAETSKATNDKDKPRSAATDATKSVSFTSKRSIASQQGSSSGTNMTSRAANVQGGSDAAQSRASTRDVSDVDESSVSGLESSDDSETDSSSEESETGTETESSDWPGGE